MTDGCSRPCMRGPGNIKGCWRSAGGGIGSSRAMGRPRKVYEIPVDQVDEMQNGQGGASAPQQQPPAPKSKPIKEKKPRSEAQKAALRKATAALVAKHASRDAPAPQSSVSTPSYQQPPQQQPIWYPPPPTSQPPPPQVIMLPPYPTPPQPQHQDRRNVRFAREEDYYDNQDEAYQDDPWPEHHHHQAMAPPPSRPPRAPARMQQQQQQQQAPEQHLTPEQIRVESFRRQIFS